MPESNLQAYCVINPQMLSQEEFQELHLFQILSLGMMLRNRNFDMGTLTIRQKKIKTCAYCNPTDSVCKLFSTFSRIDSQNKPKTGDQA